MVNFSGFAGPRSLSQLLNSAAVDRRQTLAKHGWARLGANHASLTDTGNGWGWPVGWFAVSWSRQSTREVGFMPGDTIVFLNVGSTGHLCSKAILLQKTSCETYK